ncbi:MAG TPA: transglutaminase family protein [Polyangia bacterium]|jgi:tetratricopeptide (TPR) repeat protein|nr:transglutaminase family protein [Polyangia bacterium]
MSIRRRRFLVAMPVGLGAVAACRRAAEVTPVTPFARAVLEAGEELGASTRADADAGAGELSAIAARVRALLQQGAARSPATAFNTVVFETLRYEREVDDTDLRFVLLPSVLRLRRGSCVGLGTLYLALGDMLKVLMEGVMVPGHFYVRAAEDGRPRNIELLRRGEAMPNDWYRARYPISGGPVPLVAAAPEGRHDDSKHGEGTHGRVLASQEVLGVIAYNIGQEHRRLTRLPEARRAYQAAVGHFPDFAEAHASLGTVHHLLGDLPAASAAYRKARQLNPQLPGLDRNVQLLDAEARQPR